VRVIPIGTVFCVGLLVRVGSTNKKPGKPQKCRLWANNLMLVRGNALVVGPSQKSSRSSQKREKANLQKQLPFVVYKVSNNILSAPYHPQWPTVLVRNVLRRRQSSAHLRSSPTHPTGVGCLVFILRMHRHVEPVAPLPTSLLLSAINVRST
jgi:hypothetical protein